MWLLLNIKTHISIIKEVGQTEIATIYKGIGQGSFGGPLALSLTEKKRKIFEKCPQEKT